MTAPARRPGLVGPLLSTLAMLAILLGLGVWQLQRRDWKRALLDQIAAAEQAPPVPLAEGLPAFAKVAVTGRLRTDLLVRFAAEVRGATLGGQVLAPLQRPGAPTLLVDLGWAAQDSRPVLPDGTVTIAGYLRPGDHPGWFAAADDAAGRQFYTLDPQAIGAALGLDLAPQVLVALGGPPPPGAPDPARHLPNLPNDHLQYAITWFALAAVLLVVFVLYVRRRPAA